MGDEKLQIEKFQKYFRIFFLNFRNIDDAKFLDEEKCEKKTI